MNNNPQNSNTGKTAQYVAGFVLSLALTITAYLSVQHHIHTGHISPSDNSMIAILSGLAIAQLLVQLVFFFHLNRGSGRRWNNIVLLFAATVVLIIVIGSLWIMNNLDYRMTPQQMNQYMTDQESGGL